MAKRINWGIIGCGGIAHTFANDIKLTKRCKLIAAGSRTAKKAKNFAAKFGIERSYGSYESLVEDKDIDAVYIATPHPYHIENTLLAIAAGKSVLCEKPITMNAKQLRRIITAAKKKNVFVMEAMWTRFLPSTVYVRKCLADGLIGNVFDFRAEFGVRFSVSEAHRVLNPALGGGTLLDLGIYPVSFASMIYGEQPEKIVSAVHFSKTGVDDQAAMAFQYKTGAMASLTCECRVDTKKEACIYGDKGMIIVHPNFYCSRHLSICLEGKKAKEKKFSWPGTGFQFEIDHVAECISKGKTESDIMPLAENLAIMQTLDKIRKQWNLRYPNE